MSNSDNPIEVLYDTANNYYKTTVDLIKLKAIDKVADIISSIAIQFSITFLLVLLSLSFSIGMALWIGDLLGKNYYGFFVITGFYAIVISIVYFTRIHCIKSPIQDTIIKQMLK